MTESCGGTCRFFGPERKHIRGKVFSTCRPGRPEITHDSERLPDMEEPARVGKWPWVASNEWCGAHQAKEPADSMKFGELRLQPKEN